MVNHAKYKDRRVIGHMGLFVADVGVKFKYANTSELVNNLKSLTKDLSPSRLEEEILGVSADVLCLPPHSFAILTDRVVQTIDSVPIRRLANVAQLAFCYHVYPGASHTRKEHVIGVFNISTRFLHQLLTDTINPIASLIVTRRHQRLLLLSSLLHDIAHIPLMHELEDSLPELTQERLLSEILSAKSGDNNFITEIDRILKIWNLKREELQVVLGRKEFCQIPRSAEGKEMIATEEWQALWERPEYELIRSIIDGAVDSDKMDYLQRDALHVGVQFGHGVDLARLERQLTGALWLEPSSKAGITWRPHCRVAATKKGQAAAEAMIAVRHNMYSQVYAHRTVRAARAMLNYIVWIWTNSPCYAGKTAVQKSIRLFEFVTGIDLSKNIQSQILQEENEPDIGHIEPDIYDNLPYAEAKLIRWFAAISNNVLAKLMAENIIKRVLYKQICEIGEKELDTFLNRSYPKTGRQRLRESTVWGADEWLKLTDFLRSQVILFLGSEDSQVYKLVLQTKSENDLPPILIDVSLPKTMRSQKALKVQRDALGSTTTWSRLDRIKDDSDCIAGLKISDSSVYEVYGGRGESVAKLIVRLFARPDLAYSLRTHVDERIAADWLNSFDPPDTSS